MGAMTKIIPDFDPESPEDFDSAHAEYARLRRECPVAHTDGLGGFWALTRYEDVKRAASDYSAFTTTQQNVVPKVAFTGRRPPLHLDPPEHTPYRKALNPLLGKERADLLEPKTRELTRAALAPLVAKGGGDICVEFSSYLPVQVFGEWMRMPAQWLPRLHQAGRAFVLAVHMNQPETMKETSLALYYIARALIALRHEQPEDPALDPTSALLAARHEGEALTDDLIVGTVRQVLVVGIVAPMVMVGNMAVHLSREPIRRWCLRLSRSFCGFTPPIAALRARRWRISRWAVVASMPESRLPCFMPRPIATRRCFPMATNSSSTAPILASIWPLVGVRIIAPACILAGWN